MQSFAMALSDAEIMMVLMRWRSRVSASAWLVVRDAHAAEDIFQNVCLKVVTKGGVFPNEAALVSWVIVVARREALDWLRRHRREAVGLGEGLLVLLEREWVKEDGELGGARIDALRDCLERLPGRSRQLLCLRYHDGLRCDEIASRLRLELNVVYKRLSRLHQALRLCVERRMTRSQAGHA